MDEIDQIIARVPNWKTASSIKYERIGGLTNTNYRVLVDGEPFFLRISGKNTSQLGIDRNHEASALYSASEAGIAPRVIAFLQPEGHLVEEWIQGYHWNAAEFRNPANVRLFTDTVRQIHHLPQSKATFSPFRRVEGFFTHQPEIPLATASELRFLPATMHKVEADQANDGSAWQKFCHNDLVSVNYLLRDKDNQIIVLVWEFSGVGDIYYDLATIVFTHDNVGPIPPDLEQIMLERYFGTVNEFQIKRLQGMKYMLMLFTGMWGLAQNGLVMAGLIPKVEGFDFQEFASWLFTHDILQLQIAYMSM